MGRRPVAVAVSLLVILAVAAGLSRALAPAGSGPHDVAQDQPKLEEVWLPRHREVLAKRRGAFPVGRLPDHRAAKLSFRLPKRMSSDVLGPPPAQLAGAQAETQTEPYIAVNPEDPKHMVAGWQETRFRDGGARSLGVAVSMNGGRSWTDALVPGLSVVDGGEWPRVSDPWPAFGPDGVAYFNSLLVDGRIPGPSALGVSVSHDGGLTWGDPVEVVRDELDFHDKNSMVVDTTGSKHRGTAYVGWDINVARNGQLIGEQRVVVSRSTDQGTTWSRPVRVLQDDVGVGVVMRVGPDGTLYAIWAGASPGDEFLTIRFARSTNGGRRFTRPEGIADFLAVGVEGYRSGAILPSLEVDPVTGDLFVVWPDGRFNGVDHAAMIVSRDGGDTWSDPVRVDDGPGDAPAMTVGVAANAAGELVVGYYTVRSPARANIVDYYVNRSTDGGVTFEEGVRVNRKSFDARFAAESGTAVPIAFLGDYVGLAGTDTGFVAAITMPLKRSKLGPGRQPDIFGVVTRR